MASKRRTVGEHAFLGGKLTITKTGNAFGAKLTLDDVSDCTTAEWALGYLRDRVDRALELVVAKLAEEHAKTEPDPIGTTRHEYEEATRTGMGAVHSRRIAYRLTVLLGHTALRQGDSVECSKCGRSGTASKTLTGPVHTEYCR